MTPRKLWSWSSSWISTIKDTSSGRTASRSTPGSFILSNNNAASFLRADVSGQRGRTNSSPLCTKSSVWLLWLLCNFGATHRISVLRVVRAFWGGLPILNYHFQYRWCSFTWMRFTQRYLNPSVTVCSLKETISDFTFWFWCNTSTKQAKRKGLTSENAVPKRATKTNSIQSHYIYWLDPCKGK